MARHVRQVLVRCVGAVPGGCRMASRASDRLPARSRGCTLGEGVLQLTSEASPSARVLHVTQATEIRRRISMDHAHPLSRESGKGKGKGKGRGRGGDRGGGSERGFCSLFSKYPPLPRVRLTCRLSRLRFRRPLRSVRRAFPRSELWRLDDTSTCERRLGATRGTYQQLHCLGVCGGNWHMSSFNMGSGQGSGSGRGQACGGMELP